MSTLDAARRSTLLAALDGVRVVEGEHFLVAQCTHDVLARALAFAGIVVDALFVDAPYSRHTHVGHEAEQYDSAERRALDYDAWTPDDVAGFVTLWEPLIRGWFVSLTDDELCRTWKAKLGEADRATFPLVPCTERGATVRMTGGGPSSCTTFAVVARPRTHEFLRWAVAESHYVVARERKPVVGGKALALMVRLVSDYSLPGNIVADPCMGGGTSLVAAVRLGRFAIGCEPHVGHVDAKGKPVESRFEVAARLLRKARPQMRMDLGLVATTGKQSALDLPLEVGGHENRGEPLTLPANMGLLALGGSPGSGSEPTTNRTEEAAS